MIANSNPLPAPETVNQPDGFDYVPGFLDSARATALLGQLHAEIDWRQDAIQLFGQSRLQPRLTAWCADPGVRYSYSGLDLEPCAWHQELDALRGQLQDRCGHRFNSVLLNAYRDGNDSMGWHADNEPELGPEPVIASLSLGDTRRLRVRPVGGGSSLGLDLDHGSLLLMSGRSQHDWQHAIPKTRRPVGLRINLTYRWVG